MAVPPDKVLDTQPCKLGLRTLGSCPSALLALLDGGGGALSSCPLPSLTPLPAPGRAGWKKVNQGHIIMYEEAWEDPAVGALGLGQLFKCQLSFLTPIARPVLFVASSAEQQLRSPKPESQTQGTAEPVGRGLTCSSVLSGSGWPHQAPGWAWEGAELG